MAKRKQNGNGNSSQSLFGLELKKIQPLTENQKRTFSEYQSGKNLFLDGIAGTGKSFISLYLAISDLLKHKEIYYNILVIKSIVQTRQIGYLPGTIQEKIKDYEFVYSSIVNGLFGRDDAYSLLSSKGILSFESTSFLRGRTIQNTILIVDEVQNMTFHELDTIITRLGNNSRIIFIGDRNQMDIDKRSCGFADFLSILEKMPDYFSIVTFDINDIVRSGLVKAYMLAKYDK